MTDMKCPECGSTHVEEVDTRTYYCEDCDHEWWDVDPNGSYILVDGFAHTIEVVHGDGGYEFIKSQLGNVTLDCVVRVFGGQRYDCWIDDEFLCKDLPRDAIACAEEHCREVLLGKVLIANRNECGGTVPLTDEDIERIMGRRAIIYSADEEMDGIEVTGYSF